MPGGAFKPPPKRDWLQTMRTVAPYLHLGWTLAASIVLGILGGRWADAKLGTEPWLMLLGAVLGVGSGLYYFLKTVLRLNK
ncbi:MAG: hypothetical protein KatS3mg131_3685 [Candidatus Tectimicrobiota bacterium]|nr:MAG: hypothetical protein KatS3mg131_3685 [Candidatus Tectomicrobia bacterium]